MTSGVNFKAGLAFARAEFYNASVYRMSFWLSFVYTFLMMYSVGHVWRVLYEINPERVGVGLQEMTTYAVLGIALVAVMHREGPQFYIMEQVRTGRIELDILKPMNFLFYMMCKYVGFGLTRMLGMVLPSLVVAYFLFGFSLPTFVNGAEFLMSVALAFLVVFMLKFMMGLVSMITMNIQNIMMAYNAIQNFFGGMMVPLWLFPGILGTVSLFLPFRSIYYIPISIYIGRYEGIGLIAVLGLQLLWIFVLGLFARLLMQFVFRRMMVQGG